MSIMKRVVAGEKVVGLVTRPETVKFDSKCSTCRTPILWRYTPNKKLMPLDARPLEGGAPGCYVVVSREDCRPWEPMFDGPATVYHMNHWATCPQSEKHRR